LVKDFTCTIDDGCTWKYITPTSKGAYTRTHS
jgi:hypothetical protein